MSALFQILSPYSTVRSKTLRAFLLVTTRPTQRCFISVSSDIHIRFQVGNVTVHSPWATIQATHKISSLTSIAVHGHLKTPKDVGVGSSLYSDSFQIMNVVAYHVGTGATAPVLAVAATPPSAHDQATLENIYSLVPGSLVLLNNTTGLREMYNELMGTSQDFCAEIDTKQFVHDYHTTHPHLPAGDIMMYINNTLTQEWILKKLDHPITENFIFDIHENSTSLRLMT
ncbi:hypothetical protein PROFUN_15114 [Planoprotostelium fungivorum]|uniref:Uncharacterized protein n=1 Tax=Planoprotostelium fungivorum TaxID=1890364 RepID=A0A2P6MZV7_9EUKA|nr:hypothetical protein PROFUN_15114 [Planoprotostelium fungivorum]